MKSTAEKIYVRMLARELNCEQQYTVKRTYHRIEENICTLKNKTKEVITVQAQLIINSMHNHKSFQDIEEYQHDLERKIDRDTRGTNNQISWTRN